MDSPPRTVDEWLALPELAVRAIRDPHSEHGDVYRVVAIGFVHASPAELRLAGAPEVGMPVVTLGSREAREYRRLPFGLAQWAFDVVALARSVGSPFPADVEFCNLNGRFTADIR